MIKEWLDIQKEYEKIAFSTVEKYKEDITIHDRQIIHDEFVDGNIGYVIFFLRECGSHTLVLTFQQIQKLPFGDEVVPYIFGKANRAHLI